MSPTSPEQWIRKYLLENEGRATVPVHNLLTTWRLEGLDGDALLEIDAVLAEAGITVDPPLTPGTVAEDLVTLYLDAEPQPEPPPEPYQPGSETALHTEETAPETAPKPGAPPERIRLHRRVPPSTPPQQPSPGPSAPPPPLAPGRAAAGPPDADEAPQALRRRQPHHPSRLPSDPPPERRPTAVPGGPGARLPSDPPPERRPTAVPVGPGARLPADPAPSAYRQPPPPPEPAPRPQHQPQPPHQPRPSGPLVPVQKAGPLAGIPMRMELNQLRRRHDDDLRAFGSLLFELYRTGSDRPELVDERMDALQESSEQILRTEESLGISTGGVCPGCGLYCSDARVCLACGRELNPPSSGVTRRMSVPVVLVGIVMLTAAWLFGGLGSGDEQRSRQPERATAAPLPPEKRFQSVSTTVRGPRIAVYRSPGARKPKQTLSNPNIDGAPLVFLIKKTRGDWAYVYLPVRPNGSMGWIKLNRNTDLEGHDYRLTIDLGKRTVKAWKGAREIVNEQVGVGRAVTPTPTGRYYITELLKQPEAGGTYGPYAFGLSVHSNVLHEFAGADGILGIHGTNEPQFIGTDVSHGCIRVYNSVIRKLARTLPVGTPVRIQRT